MIARGQLHVEETRPVKDSADAVLCMFAAEASMHAGDGCVFVLISEDAIFLQAQTTLQAKRRTVMLVRSRSYDEVGTIVVQLNHQTMDDLVYLDGVRRGGKTAAQKGGAFGAASHPTNSSDHHKKPSSSKTKKPARVISLQQPGNVLQGRHVAFRQGGEGQGGPSQHGQGQAPLPPSAFAQSNQSHHPPLSATLHPDCLPPPMVPPAPQDVPRQLADRSQRPSGYEMHRRVTSHATPAGAHARGRWCANGKPTREVGAALRAFVQGQRHSRVVAALAARHLDENCPGWRGNAHSASLTPLRYVRAVARLWGVVGACRTVSQHRLSVAYRHYAPVSLLHCTHGAFLTCHLTTTRRHRARSQRAVPDLRDRVQPRLRQAAGRQLR